MNLIRLLPKLAALRMYDNSVEADSAKGQAPVPMLVFSSTFERADLRRREDAEPQAGQQEDRKQERPDPAPGRGGDLLRRRPRLALRRIASLPALARTRMERLTPKTITTQAAFNAELRRIRAADHAIDDEEHYEGLRCIAMPVFAYTGQVFASMCVLGPKHRMTHQKLMAVRGPLAVLSRKLSERLGYKPK